MILATKAARELIVQQIKATWCPGDDDPITIGAVREEKTHYPQAIIVTGPDIERDYTHGVRSVREDYRFFIEGRFEIPSDGTIDDLQADAVHSLGLRLVGDLDTAASADWATNGLYWPKIVNVQVPTPDTDQKYYQVVLVLELSSDVLQ